VQLGVILFDFAPDFQVAGLTVRWETVAVAGAILVAVGVAALLAGRSPGRSAGPSRVPAEDEPEAAGSPEMATLSRLDLLLIVLSAVPGAIVGGRIGYVLIHLDYYAAHPSAIVDPGQGSLELSLATIGGTITGLVVAYGLRAPLLRWLDVAAIPMLLGLGLGKLAMALSADGQGVPSDAPWATAYAGLGPWGSLAPEVPSHPAQIYEGTLILLAGAVLVILFVTGRFHAQDGRAFLAALSGWGVVRLGVAFVWRDPTILGPLRAAQLIALAVAAGSLLLLLAWPRLVGRPVVPPDG
jgi:phosphatidylglycerol:prolipoprotein diacylglycerol transferase